MSVFSYGSIIGDSGFFRENALAVLLFKAIFKLNKASPYQKCRILSGFPQTETPSRLLRWAPRGSREHLPYKQTWPREAGLPACKNNVRGDRVNSLHLLRPLGCVTELLVETSKSAVARNMWLWNRRMERFCFRQLFMVKEDFYPCPVFHNWPKSITASGSGNRHQNSTQGLSVSDIVSYFSLQSAGRRGVICF